MKNIGFVFLFLLLVNFTFSQGIFKLEIRPEKMGDGLYDFYALNHNHVPLQLKLYFTELENMSANVNLPFVSTIQPGKHLIFTVRRDFTEIPGSFQYKFSTRIGAYPVVPDQDYLYSFPNAKGDSVLVIPFDFSTSNAPQKIEWGFHMKGNDKIRACREGVVCLKSERFKRDEKWIGENSLTLLHPDHTFGRYELFDDNSFEVEIGDSVKQGDVLGKVESNNSRITYTRFSVYYVDASIDSIEEHRIRNFHAFINPRFTFDNSDSFFLEGKTYLVK